MATTSIWDKLKNIIMPSTTGPVQVADPNIAMWQGMQQMEQAKQQGQANNLAAVLKFQADQQAQKDLGNQALQNQLASRPGAAWGPNGILRKEQLANPALEAIPKWARAEFVNTPAGMQQALGVSQAQRPYVDPSLQQQQQSGITYNDNMENGASTGRSAYGQDGTLKGFSQGNVNPAFVGPLGAGEFYQPSAQLSKSMQQANAPFANWQGLLNQSNQDLANPQLANELWLKSPQWAPYAQPQAQPVSLGGLLSNLLPRNNASFR